MFILLIISNRIEILASKIDQILPILILGHRGSYLKQLLRSNPSLSETNSLQTGDLESLTLLDNLNKG